MFQDVYKKGLIDAKNEEKFAAVKKPITRESIELKEREMQFVWQRSYGESNKYI